MASIFRRGGKRTGCWQIQWFDDTGKRRSKNSKTTDKSAAQRIANKLEADAALRRDGVIDPALERFAQEQHKPLETHAADFRAAVAARENTPKHVDMTDSRVRLIIEQCGASQVKHLTPAAVQNVLKTKRDDGSSLETCNSYLRAIKAFSRWLWLEKRIPDDPLSTLKAFNTASDQRHPRRKLMSDEITWLLPFVEGYTLTSHNLPGPDRAMVYRLALGTGFRALELRSLVPESFNLNGNPPTITVQAGCSKRRRTDVQPIRRDLADMVQPWLAGKPNGKPLFARLPGATAQMLRKDLAAARKAWIKTAENKNEKERREKSDFLRYEDSAGRIADFHSTRHTYISNIVASGASVKTAQELARHSTPTLTIGRYSHTRLHDIVGGARGAARRARSPWRAPANIKGNRY